MKTKIWLAASSFFALGAGGLVNAGGPPPSLDRPSPPPCCADGICRPNTMEWGHYPTRWRRWPTDYLEPLPPEAQPPAPLGPDVPGYEPPSPEEEDRRAPPPTAPRGEAEGEDRAPAPPASAPGEGEAPTRPGEPTTPRTETPTTLPFGDPGDAPPIPPQPYDTSPPPSTLPFGGEPPVPLPFGEPMGDADPPPALPFAAPTRGRMPTTRAAMPLRFQPAHRPMRASQPGESRPAAPLAMMSWAS